MLIKVVWEMSHSFILTTGRIDHAVAGTRWYAVIASHFRVHIFNPKPPVPLRLAPPCHPERSEGQNRSFWVDVVKRHLTNINPKAPGQHPRCMLPLMLE